MSFFFVLFWVYRDGLDGECSYYHGGYWVGGFVVGLGDGAARLGGWTYSDVAVFVCDLLYFHSSCCLLPLRRLCQRQEELYLHGRRPEQPR